MLNIVVYVISLSAVLAIASPSIAALFEPGFEFWPPPSTESWQYRTFRWLFRIFFVGLVTLTLPELGASTVAVWRLVICIPLIVVGFGLALYWTNFLGWRNAFGEPEGLKTGGIYRFSRNPIYAVSIVGMLGWALIVGTWSVASLLAAWALLYIGAPFVEEPWLEKQYGESFTSYKASVPRFVGFLPKSGSAS